MRGEQLTDQDGKVTFKTIVPGWYSGRAVHIHLRVAPLVGTKEFTTQLYFDQIFLKRVFGLDPYKQRGLPDTSNDRDRLSGSNPDALLQLLLDVIPDGANAYKSTFVAHIDYARGMT